VLNRRLSPAEETEIDSRLKGVLDTMKRGVDAVWSKREITVDATVRTVEVT
jgi:hypothetical protein